MKEDGVGRIGGRIERWWGEFEARHALGLVAERTARETATTIDQMLPRFDAVGMTIEQRSHRLTHTRPIRTVHRTAREPGDQRAFDLLLQIDDGIVAIARQFVPECADLAPRRA